MTEPATLTIREAQEKQPWTVLYSEGVMAAAEGDGPNVIGMQPLVPHILGSHCALHAMKSIGKIAAVYEARDHDSGETRGDQLAYVSHDERETARRAEIRKMAADLMTAALRFANLEGFDLAEALIERVREKNGTAY